jgi:hypothetical protein
MPQEIIGKNGIKFVPTPDEKDRELDDQLLAVLLSMMDEEKKQEIIKIFGQDYYNRKMRKAQKAIAIGKNDGKTINVSRNPGLASSVIVSG